MVDTRNKFLSKGYYNVLKNELCIQIVDTIKAIGKKNIRLLDAGCGEGYYTQAMLEAIFTSKTVVDFNVLGVDISKLALNIAAKRARQSVADFPTAEYAQHDLPTAEFAVGSVFDLPVADKSCDIVTELFAPYSGGEFYRALKQSGVLLLVIPSTEHLYELKQAVYKKPYKNEVKGYDLEGFELIKKTEVLSEILIDNNEDIENLFTMTPYYYKTSKEDTMRLMQLDSLKTTIHFEILAYKANA